MYILSQAQIQAADAFTIQHQRIQSIDLMDRVAALLFQRVYPITEQGTAYVFCGVGNNGGDGMALATLLHKAARKVQVFAIGNPDKGSSDFQIQHQRALQAGVHLSFVNDLTDLPTHLTKHDLIIDALLGTGTNRPVEGLLSELISWINEQVALTHSIDIPSGLFADALPQPSTVAIEAQKTYTLACPKLSSMFGSCHRYYGEVELIDIGWPDEVWSLFQSKYHFLAIKDVLSVYQPRPASVSKHDLGFAQLFVGSKGKAGAAILSAAACLRGGCGLTTLTLPAAIEGMVQIAVPEAMCSSDTDSDVLRNFTIHPRATAIGVGPGIGYESLTQQGFAALLKQSQLPMVVDADAINILSDTPSLLQYLGGKAILTPHQREFDRLFGASENEWQRLQVAIENAQKYQLHILLKGMISTIVLPSGEVYFSRFGNASLAKGGSGDVLTGILTSLVASGYSLPHAAILGVFLHGYSAEKSVQNNAVESVVASEIIENIGQAFLFLQAAARN